MKRNDSRYDGMYNKKNTITKVMRQRDYYHLEPENHLPMIGTGNFGFPGAHC